MSCPRCGGRQVVPIFYGEVTPTFEELMSREWVAGGCMITENAPDRACLACDHRWLGRFDGTGGRVVPQAHEPRSPGVLGLAALVDALIAKVRWEETHGDVADYHSLRYQLLCQELGLPADPLVSGAHVRFGPHLEREEAEGLLRLLREAVTKTELSVSPFEGLLEAGEQVDEIYQQHDGAIRALTADHEAVKRSVAYQCLAAVEPELVDRTTTEARFIRLGLPAPHDELG